METGSTTKTELWDEIDLAALELAISQTLAEKDNGRVSQVKDKLRDEDRIKVGRFCAYHRQMMALNLEPWERPPCWIEDPDAVLRAPDKSGGHSAAKLLKRMLALNISQFHPNPLAAIEAAGAITP